MEREKAPPSATERIHEAVRAAQAKKKREEERDTPRQQKQRQQDAEQGQGRAAGGGGLGVGLVAGYAVGRMLSKPAPAPDFRGFLQENDCDECEQDLDRDDDAGQACESDHDKSFDGGTQRVRGGHEPDFGD
ncbi:MULTISPECIES: hypothetical protein [Xanthomonas]|uniref:hypothetical protein n=1 Tax=Xanthomonas TaxID=338 RepID=UPI0002C3E406|nr:hypothetical protein [Xanthomonas citri]AGI10584.1 hypothetical protein XCAW_b00064 [Xanthomonas citri subsp. citri Aw12879]AJZ42242.1 hypothetical protein J165_00076 [Xanthomonas citri pv. citri]AJZ46858.1 hypothetical protein J166_00077 [Xanthomonas citri pv. citri]AJZ51477.1 hypothetical protein J167_00076 [Xanthomonas citri pv. citri]AJZ64272.1 hypothetical protein J168_00076 [Xanthomonas citri pv. citri]